MRSTFRIASLAVALCLLARAQVQGNLPQLIDSGIADQNFSGSTFDLHMPEGTNAGDLIVACETWDANGGTGTFSITDSQGNTYSIVGPNQVPNPFATPGRMLEIGYAIAGSTGANVIHFGPPPGFAYQWDGFEGRFSHASATLDGPSVFSTISNSTFPTPSIQQVFNTVTTTFNTDIAVTCSGASIYGSNFFVQGSNAQHVNDDSNSGILSWEALGAPGSYTTGNVFDYTYQAGSLTVVFEPSVVKIATTQFLDCAVGLYCEENLQGSGGSGAYNWGILGGSCPGMTLSGAKFSGTPTTSGGCSLSVQLTDSAGVDSATFNWYVFPSFLTPTIRNSTTASFDSPGSVAVNTVCGDVIMVIAHGDNTHGSSGWVQMGNGTNNYFADSFGSPVSRVIPTIGGTRFWPTPIYLIGPVQSTGVDHVTWQNTQGTFTGCSGGPHCGSSGRGSSLVADLYNVQPIGDPVTKFDDMFDVGSNSITNSYLTVVPNTLVISASADDVAVTSTSIGSGPFTAFQASPLSTDQQGYSLYSYSLVASPSAVSIRTDWAGATQPGGYTDTIFGLRPSGPPQGACTTKVPHRTDIK